MFVTMIGEAWPDWMRRVHASYPDLNSPSDAGIVRVA
jgi:hypothetical protein